MGCWSICLWPFPLVNISRSSQHFPFKRCNTPGLAVFSAFFFVSIPIFVAKIHLGSSESRVPTQNPLVYQMVHMNWLFELYPSLSDTFKHHIIIHHIYISPPFITTISAIFPSYPHVITLNLGWIPHCFPRFCFWKQKQDTAAEHRHQLTELAVQVAHNVQSRCGGHLQMPQEGHNWGKTQFLYIYIHVEYIYIYMVNIFYIWFIIYIYG